MHLNFYSDRLPVHTIQFYEVIRMLSHLHGTVTHITDQLVIIDVNGIGFELHITQPGTLSLNKPAKLITYLHWNQEQGPSLFGFHHEQEKNTFTLIISCSGIGPKIALAVLRDLGATHFLQAVNSHNIEALSSVSGIGAKKAEQMIVALKGKVSKLIASGSIDFDGATTLWKDVNDALLSLNYSRPEISRAVSILKIDSAKTETSPTFEIMFRKVLALLSKRS